MKIDHIECINLLFDYPNRNGFRYGGGVCTSRVTSVVRVHTDDGRVGVGSAYSHPAMVHLVVEGQLSPVLRGEDPLDVERLWDRMYGLTRWYGRKGAAVSALGAIDVALWDLRGKAAGKPVWELLGGGRESCPVYASGLLWQDLDDLSAEAARHLDAGFRRMKMRLARSEELDREMVRRVRATIGPVNDLMVDCSMRYHLELAQRMGAFFGEQGVFWCEEPFLPEDIDSYAALHGTIPVPVAAGENEFGLQGFRELARAGAVDIVQPDACRCGGITEVWRVAQLAARHQLQVAPHTWSDAVAMVANAHVVAAIPHGLTVEMDRTGNPFIEELLVVPPQVDDGRLALGRGPGLGIELREDTLEKYRMPDPLRIPNGTYSDMAFGGEYQFTPPDYHEGS